MKPPGSALSAYAAVNAATRIEVFDEIPEVDYEVAVRGFLRHAGVGHLYDERIRPTLQAGESALFVGVVDREWPPWGLGAHTILALCQTHKVGDKRYGVSPVFAHHTHLVNIGLLAAVFKEALDHVSKLEGEVNYLVRDGARHASMLLAPAGFSRVNEFFQDQVGRYFIHRVAASSLRDHLGLGCATADLLAEDIPDESFVRQAVFLNGLRIASDSWAREIIAIDGGLDDSLPPTTITGTMEDPWQMGQMPEKR